MDNENSIKEQLRRERKLREACGILNDVTNFDDTINKFLKKIAELTQCNNVAIRLYSDGDYPYFIYDGFTEKFIKKENEICIKNSAGNRIKTKSGEYALACMCGLVISGNTDTHFPFFTESGSFWTNNTTELSNKYTKEAEQWKLRNECNIAGYESVALIPIIGKNRPNLNIGVSKENKTIIGLIQINDKKRNMFDKELIEALEFVGYCLGHSIINAVAYKRVVTNEKEIMDILHAAKVLTEVPENIYQHDKLN